MQTVTYSCWLFVGLLSVFQTVDDPALTKWEAEISQLEQRQLTEPVLAAPIVFYGSSSIRLWSSISDDLAPWPVYQRGYGGAKLPDIIHFAPRILGPHLGVDNPRRCRAVVLFVANDIIGKQAHVATAEQVSERFTKLKNLIREQDKTIPVFWIEVTPTRSRWDVWPEIQVATQKIRTTIDADPNAHLIATAGAFLGVDGTPRAELFREDQLHLNEAGYKTWSTLIKAKLDAELGPVVLPESAKVKASQIGN